MKKLVTSFVMLSFLLTACTGSFNLSGKLYKFHRSQEKWVDEAIFLVCIIAPVYGVTFFVDGIVLNSIEFWTGNNPVASNTQGDQGNATLAYDRDHDQVLLNIANAETLRSFTFEKSDTGVVARDNSGQIRFATVTNEDGSVSVYNGQNQLVQTIDQASAAQLRAQIKG